MTEPPTPQDQTPPVADGPDDTGPAIDRPAEGHTPATPPPSPEAPPPPHEVPPPPGAATPPPGSRVPPPPGSHVPPPPGAYPPPGNYPPPGAYGPQPGPPPPGYASSEDRTWVLVAHFGGAAGMLVLGAVGGWIAPLIALVAQGNRSPQVRAHALAALNFQLLLSIVGAVGWITACLFVGWFFLAAALLLGVVVGLIAGVAANEGRFYQYPLSNLQLVR